MKILLMLTSDNQFPLRKDFHSCHLLSNSQGSAEPGHQVPWDKGLKGKAEKMPEGGKKEGAETSWVLVMSLASCTQPLGLFLGKFACWGAKITLKAASVICSQ